NVAEWVADVYRDKVDMKMSDFNYYRGNQFTQNVINKDGSVIVINDATIQYDTLRSGVVVARGLPGEVMKEEVSDDQVFARTNYDRGDNRDYNDGDWRSSRYYYEGPEGRGATQRMYNSP